MYTRALGGLLIITGNSLSKSEYLTRSLNGIVKLCSHNTTYNYNTNFINIRSCATVVRQTKIEIAQKKFDEYMQDPDIEKQYKVIELEIEIMRQNGENVPNVLTVRDWVELIELKSVGRRRRYLDFIFKNEKKRENAVEKRKIKSENRKKYELENPECDIPMHLQYRLGGNSYFLRFYDTTINHFYNWRLFRAMMYGHKCIIDCGHEDKMTRNEVKNCARQLQLAFATNRAHDNPFDLLFCNLNPNGFLHNELYSYIPTMYQPEFPINVTEKCYLDLFDKKQLVYLTPDCKDEINIKDKDSIYIVGAIVDKVNSYPLSMAKAKRQGIRMGKLPLDRYLDFGSGSGKCLTINQMLDILADAYTTSDWEYSLRHVPKRKLLANREYQMNRKMENIMMKQNRNFVDQTEKDFSMSSRRKFRDNL